MIEEGLLDATGPAGNAQFGVRAAHQRHHPGRHRADPSGADHGGGGRAAGEPCSAGAARLRAARRAGPGAGGRRDGRRAADHAHPAGHRAGAVGPHGGPDPRRTTSNIIPESAFLEATLRTLSERTRVFLHEQVRMVCQHTAAAYGCTASVQLEPGYRSW